VLSARRLLATRCWERDRQAQLVVVGMAGFDDGGDRGVCLPGSRVADGTADGAGAPRGAARVAERAVMTPPADMEVGGVVGRGAEVEAGRGSGRTLRRSGAAP
jgi:hypothetical protein